MNAANTPKPNQPNLAELMVGFVSRAADAAAIEAEAGALGEVEPHEVAVGFRADPRLAWQEGLTALTILGLASPKTPAPAEWAAVVVRQGAVAAQPFAVGCYPQRVRDLTALLQSKDLSQFRTKAEMQPTSSGLRKWVDKQDKSDEIGNRLLAAAALRAAGDFDAAREQLSQLQPSADWSACVENERAATLWQQGEWEQAASIWEKARDSTVSWFNRGMAALFLRQPGKARECLKKSIGDLPESSGWHHLAGLYLALAEMRN